MSDFSLDDATSLINNPMLYMGMTGMNPSAQNMNQYAGNVLRRGAIYGSMREPRPTGVRGPRGSLAPMPGAGAGYQFDPNAIDAANTALQSVDPRLSEPTQINPFLFFQSQNADGSPTWAAHHPGVARAIEGAMVGATTPPGTTTGENISNVARTVLGIPGMYRQNAAAQMEAPFETAGQILGLRHTQAQIDQEQAQTQYYRAHAAALGVQKQTPELKFNNGEAYSFDYTKNDWVRRPEFDNAKPTDGRHHNFDSRDYIDQINAERQKNGQPPLSSQEALDAAATFDKKTAVGKAAGHVPRIDPDLQFRVNQADKDISHWTQIYNDNKPKDSVEAQIMQQADPERWKRYNDADANLRKAQDAKAQLLQQHYNYSQSQQTSDQADDSDIPDVVAPVRTGPGPALPQGTTVTTNDGKPGQVVQTPNGPAIIPAQPGTTKKPPAKSQPQKTAAQDPNNPLDLKLPNGR